MNIQDTKEYVSGAITTINNTISNVNTLSSTKLEIINSINCYADLSDLLDSAKNGDIYYVIEDQKYYVKNSNQWKEFSDLNLSNISGNIITYVDEKDSEVRDYVDQKIINISGNINDIKIYIDNQDQHILSSANNYADNKVTEAIEFATDGFYNTISGINNQISTISSDYQIKDSAILSELTTVSTTIKDNYIADDTSILTTLTTVSTTIENNYIAADNQISAAISGAVSASINEIKQSVVGVFTFKGVKDTYTQLKNISQTSLQDGDVYQVTTLSGSSAQEDGQIKPGEVEHNVEFTFKRVGDENTWIKLGSTYDFSVFARQDYVDSNIGDLNNQITTTNNKITYLSGQIDNRTGIINSNTTNINTLSGKINTNIDSINYLSGQISGNTDNITSNAADITILQNTINDLNDQISILTGQIRELSAALQAFSGINQQ